MTTVPNLLTVQQVAKMMKMTKDGVKYGVKTGKLQFAAITGKSYLFTKEQVEDWRKAVRKTKLKALSKAKNHVSPRLFQRIQSLEQRVTALENVAAAGKLPARSGEDAPPPGNADAQTA